MEDAASRPISLLNTSHRMVAPMAKKFLADAIPGYIG